MAFQIYQLIAAQEIANTATTYFTCPTGTTVRIDALSVTNQDTAPHTITINLVTSGGSASTANVTTDAQVILPGQTFNSPNEVGKVLNSGDFISLTASAASHLVAAAGGLLQF